MANRREMLSARVTQSHGNDRETPNRRDCHPGGCGILGAALVSSAVTTTTVDSRGRDALKITINWPRIGRRHHGQSCVNHRVRFETKAPGSGRGAVSDCPMVCSRVTNSIQQSSVFCPDDQLVAGELHRSLRQRRATFQALLGRRERRGPHVTGYRKAFESTKTTEPIPVKGRSLRAALVMQPSGSRSCRRHQSETGGRAAPS